MYGRLGSDRYLDACVLGWRPSRQREQSFGDDLREAEGFALKIEHDKRACLRRLEGGREPFREAAGTWLNQHLGADSSIVTYRSVLRAHIDPAIGGKPIGTICREDIKTLSPSRLPGQSLVQLQAAFSQLVRVAARRGRTHPSQSTHRPPRRSAPCSTSYAHRAVPAGTTQIDTLTPGAAGAESVLTHGRRARRLPAETARRSTITQIYEGTNQIQRMVMARQLLK